MNATQLLLHDEKQAARGGFTIVDLVQMVCRLYRDGVGGISKIQRRKHCSRRNTFLSLALPCPSVPLSPLPSSIRSPWAGS
eukprot:COSAG02_NODE_723_length_18041_cov_7.464720_17_plen_81_part_00